MKGKEKCKALKEIRQQIAAANDISYAVSECTHQGDCKGTCPKCEAELRYLERELAIRKGLGKAVAVVGLSAGVCATVTACSPLDALERVVDHIRYEDELEGMATELEGAMPAPTEEVELTGDVAVPDTDITDDDIAGFISEEEPAGE